MPTPTANGTPSTFFEPRDNESLWKLVTTPHPLVGKARHLGEALVNAEMVAPATLMAGLLRRISRMYPTQAPLGSIERPVCY